MSFRDRLFNRASGAPGRLRLDCAAIGAEADTLIAEFRMGQAHQIGMRQGIAVGHAERVGLYEQLQDRERLLREAWMALTQALAHVHPECMGTMDATLAKLAAAVGEQTPQNL